MVAVAHVFSNTDSNRRMGDDGYGWGAP